MISTHNYLYLTVYLRVLMSQPGLRYTVVDLYIYIVEYLVLLYHFAGTC